MKIDRILYTHTYQVNLSEWQKIGMEASLDDHEDPKESLEILKREVEEFHRRGINGDEPLFDSIGDMSIHSSFYRPKDGNGTIPVIQRRYAIIIDEIKDCKTVEELSSFKETATKNPDLMPYYVNKMRELDKNIKA